MGLADGLSASSGSNDYTEKMSQYNSWHAQMIAIGGSIGTGFFLGTGQALAIGGPGFLVIAYTLMSLLVYCIVTAVIEISTYLPVSGASISYYCTRYVSSSLDGYISIHSASSLPMSSPRLVLSSTSGPTISTLLSGLQS